MRGALIRYCVVGTSGYLVNSALFWTLGHLVAYTVAFAAAFVAAATSNFVLNRLWTFASDDCAVGAQYLRFVTVSAAALIVDLVVLTTLVEGAGIPKLAAAAAAILMATPASFVGNRLWTFGRTRIPSPRISSGGQTLGKHRLVLTRRAA